MTSQHPKQILHKCVGCGRLYPHAFTPFCDCGHFIDIHYDLNKAVLHNSSDPYLRFFDLLPLENHESLPPVRHGITPCHHARSLGAQLGLDRLFIKDETSLPTGTTKDRMAVVSLAFGHEVGVHTLSASSTGNSSTALAHWIRHYPDMKLYLFSAEDFLHRLQVDAPAEQVTVFGLRDASFVEAGDAAQKFALRKGITPERGFFNPGRREGLKMAFMEATDEVPSPIDWYVQAISSAMGVWGAYKGAKELFAIKHIPRLPRLLCVQQESNKPMVSAFEAGSPVIRPGDIVARPQGIAKSILRGDPSRVYPYVRTIVQESNGTMVSVSEQEIRDARKRIEDTEGLSPCFTASAAVAGLIRSIRTGAVPHQDTILVNLTGSDQPRQPPPTVHWLRRGPSGWELENPANTESAAIWNS